MFIAHPPVGWGCDSVDLGEPRSTDNAVCASVRGRPIFLRANGVNSEHALHTTSKGSSGQRVDFLSGLVTIEGTMIALVDLPNLLAEQFQTQGALSEPKTLMAE
jgi:hypothetical protein